MGSTGVPEVLFFALLMIEVHATAGSILIFGSCDESCIARSKIVGVLTILIFSSSVVGTVRVMRVFVGAVNTLFSLSPSPTNEPLPTHNFMWKWLKLDS